MDELAQALDAILAETDELALEDERELWKASFVAVLHAGGNAETARDDADFGVRTYRQRFGARALEARQRRCAHEFGETGTCMLCGIDVAHARVGFTTPAPAPVVDASDCTCAIPAKPPEEHGASCPVGAPQPATVL